MNQISIETKLGTLTAAIRDEPSYPGIDIHLVRNGRNILLAWVESDESSLSPALQMRLYGNSECDEPSDSHCLLAGELDKYFDTLSQEVN